jgi:hypothetical protein
MKNCEKGIETSVSATHVSNTLHKIRLFYRIHVNLKVLYTNCE